MVRQAHNIFSRILRSKLAGESGQYLFWQLFTAGLPFLSLPFFTRVLTPEEYGYYALFAAVFGVLQYLITFSFPSKIARDFVETSLTEKSQHIAAVIWGFVFVSCLFALGLWLGLDLLGRSMPFVALMCWPVAAFGGAVYVLVGVCMEFSHKPMLYGLTRFTQGFLFYGIAAVLVFGFEFSWLGMVYGLTVGMLIAGAVGIVWMWRQGLVAFLQPDWRYIPRSLTYVLPLVLLQLAFNTMAFADRFLLKELVGLDVAGQYMVAFQLASVLFLINSAIGQAFGPWLFERLHQRDEAAYPAMAKAFTAAILLVLGAGVGMSLASPLLLYILADEAFHLPFWTSCFLCLGFGFYGVFQLMCGFLNFEHKTYFSGAILVVAGGLNVGLNLLWIPQWGSTGAALASCASFLLAALLASWVARKYVLRLYYAWLR